MMAKQKEDLGIKIGTPEEAFWTQTKKEVEANTLNARRTILMNDELIKLCDRKISEEKAKK